MWELDLCPTTKQAFLVNKATQETESWVGQIHSLSMRVDEGGKKYLKGKEQGWLEHWQQKHTVANVRLVHPRGGCSELLVKCAVFEMLQGNGRVFVSVQDMYEQLGLKLCPGNGAGWFQAKQAGWTKLSKQLGFGNEAVRKSVEYNYRTKRKTVADTGLARILSFQSINIGVLMVTSGCSIFFI